MKPTEHVLYGAAASAVAVPFYGTVGAASFFLGSILIDLDHYLDYLYFSGFRNWSIKDMFRFHSKIAMCKKQDGFLALEAFHTAEFLLALLAVGLYFKSNIVILIFTGMIFHMALDIIRLREWHAVNVRALSFIEYWLRTRKMRQRGVDPEALFHQAYQEIKPQP